MTQPFEVVKPFADAEVPGVKERLLADREFLDFLGRYRLPLLSKVLPPLVRMAVSAVLRRELKQVTDIRSFQESVSYYARRLVDTPVAPKPLVGHWTC